MEFLINLFLLPFTLLMWGLKYIIAAGLWYIAYCWIRDKYQEIDIDLSSIVKPKKKNVKDYGQDPEDYYL